MTSISHKFITLCAVVVLPLSLACSKEGPEKKGKSSGAAYKKIEKEFDNSEPSPEDRKPVSGVDSSKLDKPMEVRFEALVDVLPSPCGKAHSLRTSRNNDSSCRRAPFAVEFTYELVKDGASDGEIKDEYAERFRETKAVSFEYDSNSPHSGPTDATVKIVEFYDYGCPACAAFKPFLEDSIKGLETEVVVFYKMFPLSSHPDSPGAAQAAIAAHKQGKFTEMHAMLFENQHSHKMADLKGYAKKIGLDMAQWQKDYESSKALVDVDHADGERVGISGTPAVYINGREYRSRLMSPKYFKMWLQEALAEAI